MNAKCECQFCIRGMAGASDKDKVVTILGFHKDWYIVARNIQGQVKQ